MDTPFEEGMEPIEVEDKEQWYEDWDIPDSESNSLFVNQLRKS